MRSITHTRLPILGARRRVGLGWFRDLDLSNDPDIVVVLSRWEMLIGASGTPIR